MLQVCRQPCDDLVGVLTEIEGLRFVTGNLLEDLDRIVRKIMKSYFPFILLVVLVFVHGLVQIILL